MVAHCSGTAPFLPSDSQFESSTIRKWRRRPPPAIDWRPLSLGERELLISLRQAYANACSKGGRIWAWYRRELFFELSEYVDHLEAKYRLRTCA